MRITGLAVALLGLTMINAQETYDECLQGIKDVCALDESADQDACVAESEPICAFAASIEEAFGDAFGDDDGECTSEECQAYEAAAKAVVGMALFCMIFWPVCIILTLIISIWACCTRCWGCCDSKKQPEQTQPTTVIIQQQPAAQPGQQMEMQQQPMAPPAQQNQVQ